MGSPAIVGSSLASAAVDGASFVWSQWQSTGNGATGSQAWGQSVERWNVSVVMGATTTTLFLDHAYSANGTVYATSTLNNNASCAIGAYYGFSIDAIASTFYNFHWGATTTVKAFYIVKSLAEGSIT